jgi:two-component system chemotaxis response regulator CheY
VTWWENVGGKPVSDSILVVEDDESSRQLVTVMLELAGFTVEAAQDGGEALSRLLVDPAPRLVLLDIMMPVVDGLTILRWIKNNPATTRIPVVMISAKSDPLARHTAELHGAAGFIVKPFAPDKAIATIQGILVA